MAIQFTLPQALERDLRQRVTDLDSAAKEAFLVELYRDRQVTHNQLADALGVSRDEADGILKRHAVYFDTTLEDVLRDANISRQARSE